MTPRFGRWHPAMATRPVPGFPWLSPLPRDALLPRGTQRAAAAPHRPSFAAPLLEHRRPLPCAPPTRSCGSPNWASCATSSDRAAPTSAALQAAISFPPAGHTPRPLLISSDFSLAPTPGCSAWSFFPAGRRRGSCRRFPQQWSLGSLYWRHAPRPPARPPPIPPPQSRRRVESAARFSGRNTPVDARRGQASWETTPQMNRLPERNAQVQLQSLLGCSSFTFFDRVQLRWLCYLI
jgi:hypothetical protein